jgi:hypothetical protein
MFKREEIGLQVFVSILENDRRNAFQKRSAGILICAATQKG